MVIDMENKSRGVLLSRQIVFHYDLNENCEKY